ncbi:MAG: hypothetical protein RLZZ374_1390 [Cyanobacteriota bacterium]|jgi:hypothetical protein
MDIVPGLQGVPVGDFPFQSGSVRARFRDCLSLATGPLREHQNEQGLDPQGLSGS